MSLFKFRDPEKWFRDQEEQDRKIREKLAPFRGREDELLQRVQKEPPRMVVDNDKRDD